ncbi:hypothetical protein BHAOGJBA_4246 [Methylobacterium hispanicum]|uniref:Uncharacterized protein n=1 Tax=Methylobacterium hispanicum TaxID=270350 RepID=A0AAV4ZS11_9HYPH|nr:hypothetical protein [Methylobacterium hispanicum]GJD90704.1 hypothetical protein BHAOGJBA_4246 [Methylobacterium hispanicum]
MTTVGGASASGELALVRADVVLPWRPGACLKKVDLVIGVVVPRRVPGDAPVIGRYRVGDTVLVHRAFGGARVGPPPDRWHPTGRCTGPFEHARLFDLKDFSDLRFARRDDYRDTEPYILEPFWIMTEDVPVGPRTDEFDLSDLGRIAGVVRAEAQARLLYLAEAGWFSPRPAPRWVLQWNREGWRVRLTPEAVSPERSYRIDRLADAIRFGTILGDGRPAVADGEVLDHDPAWAPVEHDLIALAREVAPQAARERCFDPAWMPSDLVKAWHMAVNGAKHVDDTGLEGAVSVLRSFMLISDHVALARPGALKAMFGAGLLGTRLESDGIEARESVAGCPRP